MFRLAALTLLTASVSAFSGDMDPSSKQFGQLLKGATLIEGRGLADNNNNNNQLQNAIANLSLKYTGCANVYSMGNGQGGGGNNKNGGSVYNTAVVTFELRESCNGALVGKYATGMTQFTDSYTESAMTEQAWQCESFFETTCSSCQGADDEAYCYSDCISSSSTDMSACSQYIADNQGDADDFEIQRYLECGKLQNNNNNNNNNGNNNNNNNNNGNSNSAYAAYPEWDGKYRVGPYCAADGYSIMLGVFYDGYCSVAAPSTTYASLNYGATLPYSTKSIIPKSTCISCVDSQKQYENQQNGNNNNNKNGNYNYNQNQNWYNMEPKEFCVESYQTSAKCETSGSSYLAYGGTSTGCNFIKSLPTLNNAFSIDLNAPGKNPAAALAAVFAITTALFGIYSFFLCGKLRRRSDDGLLLASPHGNMA